RRAQPERIEPHFSGSQAPGQRALEVPSYSVSGFPQPACCYECLSEQARRSECFLQNSGRPQVFQLPPQTFQFFGALCAYEILNAAGLPDPPFSDEALWRDQVWISNLIAEKSQPLAKNCSRSIAI